MLSQRAHLSRINRIRSLANKPKLDRHENPNSESVKKNNPVEHAVSNSIPTSFDALHTQSVLEPCYVISRPTIRTAIYTVESECDLRDVVEEQATNH